ncbi:MAG: adenine deaminase, partial [Turicibacter sp.]
ALLHGITSMIVDPHEIANVLGTKGIELMLQFSENIPFDFYFMLPSCVPATNFESSGAILESQDLKPFYEHPRVLGLAEVMNYPAVLNTEEDMIQKLIDASAHQKTIDGHCAGFTNNLLNAYRSANVLTDHECHSPQEVIERIRRGMYVLIREGTVAKNLKDLITATTISNSRRVCLCTDDKHIDDLIQNGSIDHSIKEIIKYGLSPETAIQMATLNTSECYHLKHKGAIAPGYVADFLILDHLEEFCIESVYKDGQLVVKHNELLNDASDNAIQIPTDSSIHLPELTTDHFKIELHGKQTLNVIKLIPNKLESLHIQHDISLDDATEFISSTKKDLLKVAVIERHKASGNIGLGVLQGLELQGGAIATTIAHDSQNVIVCGVCDEDILFAVETLKDIKGGIVVVRDGQVLASIPLEIGGLMTTRPTKDVISDLDKLHHAIKEIAPTIDF